MCGAESDCVAADMLVETRQDFHEVAWLVAVVELLAQDAIPGIAACAGRTRQGEDESLAYQPRSRTRLHSGCADFVEGEAMEDDGETVHTLVEKRLQRFWCYVAACEPGAAGGDDSINIRFLAPGADNVADLLHIIPGDLPVNKLVAGLGDARGQEAAGLVFLHRSRVGNGQHGKTDGNEGAFRRAHGSLPRQMHRRRRPQRTTMGGAWQWQPLPAPLRLANSSGRNQCPP